MIPMQLNECEFLKVGHRAKRPIEANWVKNSYSYNEIMPWVEKSNNYGVLCGVNGLTVLDIDDPELLDDAKLLPPTFTVKTGSGGYHLYYIIKDMKRKVVLENDVKHYGEFQHNGSMVVGPSSIHPNGNRYEVISDYPIQEIGMDKIQFIIDKFSGAKKKVKFNINKTEVLPKNLSDENMYILENIIPTEIRHWITGRSGWKARFYAGLFLRDKGFDNSEITEFLKPFYENLSRTDTWKNNWNHFENSARVLQAIRSRTDLKFPNNATLVEEGLIDEANNNHENMVYK